MTINHLDVEKLKNALIMGMQCMIKDQEYINKINVFPVPDQDTGTNMAMTLTGVIERIHDQYYSNIQGLLVEVADAALVNSRGNSGAILAQLFQGMSEYPAYERLSVSQFADLLTSGCKGAYQALSDPKEGTILTVFSHFCETWKKVSRHAGCDYKTAFKKSLKEAEDALQKTTRQLKLLKKAKVVDAGAQGFVDILHGISQYFETGKLDIDLPKITSNSVKPKQTMEFEHSLESDFRYCTECIIAGENIDRQLLKNRLNLMGDSLVIAGSMKKAKIHIHTNEPAELFKVCREYGIVSSEKADDMIQQQNFLHHNSRQKRVAIVTDSAADIPEELMEKLDIHMVPLTLSLNQEHFIDKVSIDAKTFYKKIRDPNVIAKTSQPAIAEFKRRYQYLATHYDSIISIHLSAAGSGTLQAAKSAAANLPQEKITIIDSKTYTGALGLVVIHAAENAAKNMSHKDIVSKIYDSLAHLNWFTVVPDLSFAVRGGRVSRNKKRIVDLTRGMPVIGTNATGNVKLKGLIWGKKRMVRGFVKYLSSRVDKKKRYSIAITHCDTPRQAAQLAAELRYLFKEVDFMYQIDCSSMIGCYGGPGALSVALEEVIT